MQVMEKWEVGRWRIWGVINGGIQGLQYAIYGPLIYYPGARARATETRFPDSGGAEDHDLPARKRKREKECLPSVCSRNTSSNACCIICSQCF